MNADCPRCFAPLLAPNAPCARCQPVPGYAPGTVPLPTALPPIPLVAAPQPSPNTGGTILVVAVAVAGMVLAIVGGAIAFLTVRAPARSEPMAVEEARPAGVLEPVDALPSVSPKSARSMKLLVLNRRSAPVDLVWIDFRGARVRYATIPSGSSYLQQTYAGHVWVAVEGGADLGGFVATPEGTTAGETTTLR